MTGAPEFAGFDKGGRKGSIIHTDVTREDDIVKTFNMINKDYGRLDILAVIAGGDFENNVAIEEISFEKMSYNIDVNLKATILCCREAAKIMMKQQYGKIINMSSLVYRGSPMQFTYSAAKGGIFTFTRSAALALGMYNITVNALAPALIEVNIIKNTIGPEMWEALREALFATLWAGWGNPLMSPTAPCFLPRMNILYHRPGS